MTPPISYAYNKTKWIVDWYSTDTTSELDLHWPIITDKDIVISEDLTRKVRGENSSSQEEYPNVAELHTNHLNYFLDSHKDTGVHTQAAPKKCHSELLELISNSIAYGILSKQIRLGNC